MVIFCHIFQNKISERTQFVTLYREYEFLKIRKKKELISMPLYAVTEHSVQFRCSVETDSLQPHELQHTRPPCPSPTPRIYPNSCPLSWWCHPTISSSVIPFSSCPQSFPALGSFPMSQFFASGGQIIGASVSASVLPMNIQDWFPLGFTGLISLLSKGLSRVLSNPTVQKLSPGYFVYFSSLLTISDIVSHLLLFKYSEYSKYRPSLLFIYWIFIASEFSKHRWNKSLKFHLGL